MEYHRKQMKLSIRKIVNSARKFWNLILNWHYRFGFGKQASKTKQNKNILILLLFSSLPPWISLPTFSSPLPPPFPCSAACQNFSNFGNVKNKNNRRWNSVKDVLIRSRLICFFFSLPPPPHFATWNFPKVASGGLQGNKPFILLNSI